MKKMFLMFTHKLTPEQIQDASTNLLVDEFVYLTSELQQRWGNVPPEIDELSLKSYLEPFCEWLEDANEKDFVLIQGDYGASYCMVQYALRKGLYPVYATTKREAVETVLSDGTVKTERLFRHCRYRNYNFIEKKQS